MSIKILGIETSCDDSSMAVLMDGKILSNISYSQKIHEKYGGVVPEWASRKHLEAIVPLYLETLKSSDNDISQIDAIAVTQGPGLLGSLMVGIGFAKGLSFASGKPLIQVNHLEAHVISLLIDTPRPAFPFICLTVSGGHTQLVIVKDFNKMELVGSTIDDAAGEAYDKTGKLLGLPYPAGPHMDKLAQQGNNIFPFPISALKDYNYSFSGIKTAVLYFLKDQLNKNPDFIKENLNNLCASIQFSINEMLMIKLKKLAQKTGIKNIGIAGGVSANSGLREKLIKEGNKNQWNIYYPQLQYCTDNAAMIATVAYYKFQKSEFASMDFEALARFPIPQSK